MARAYFDGFRGFDYDETAALIDEFKRLAISRQWATDSKTYRKQRQKCFGQTFDEHFGYGEKTLQGWQSLCEEVSIRGPPPSITQCKKELTKVFVNIVDLIEARRLGLEPTIFLSKSALRRYSQATGKIFSKRKAKANGYLAALLIPMF